MILGEGEKRLQIEALIEELGLSADVTLLGFVSHPYALMSKAAVFVLSSVHEGLPTVLIEAMAVGTPVVSTDCPSGSREILDGGKYGGLVPVGDVEALAQAIMTQLTCPKNSAAAQQRSQSFSLATAVHKYLRLIDVNSV